MPAILKTLLLAVVLARDVGHIELLVGWRFHIAGAAWKSCDRSSSCFVSGLDQRRRRGFRIAVTLVASAVGMQVIAGVLAITPMGSRTSLYVLNGFTALGQTAASDMIQWMSIPWVAAAHLAVTDHYQPLTCLQLLAAGAGSAVGHHGVGTRGRVERRETAPAENRTSWPPANSRPGVQNARTGRSRPGSPLRARVDRIVPRCAADAVAVISRQWVSVKRYRGTILFSFVIPTLLCLSPLVTGQVTRAVVLCGWGHRDVHDAAGAASPANRLSPRPAADAVAPFLPGQADVDGAGAIVPAGADHVGVPVAHARDRRRRHALPDGRRSCFGPES